MPVPSDAATPPPACSQRLSSPHCKVPARRRHHWFPPVVAHSSSCRTWRIRGSRARLQLLIADDPGCIGQTTGPQANRLLCSAAASYRMRYIDTGRIVGWADAEFQRPRFPPCEGFHADGPRKTAPPVSGRHCRDPCFPPLKHLRHALPRRPGMQSFPGQQGTTSTSPDRKNVVGLWRELDARARTDDATSHCNPLVQIGQQKCWRRHASFAKEDVGHRLVIAGRC